MVKLKRASSALAPWVDFIFPPRCPLCGAGLASQSGICAECWETLVIPGQPCCALCQRPFDGAASHGQICAPCLAHPPSHDGIAAASLYNDTARKLVLTFKHGGKITLAPLMAHLMASRLPDLAGEWLVVPVPLHRWRLWQRGYNQAGLLAQNLGRHIAQPIMIDGLQRIKYTPKLGRMGAKARKQQMQNAIRVNPKHKARLNGAQIILVDDVVTSGATTNACIKALKAAGAQKVLLSCFSRVLDEGVSLHSGAGVISGTNHNAERT